MPRPADLNARVLEVLPGFGSGGGYSFRPRTAPRGSGLNPRDPSHEGVQADLYGVDGCFARRAGEGWTYCCGVTLEAWWRALPAERQRALPASRLRALVDVWFCPTTGHPGSAGALVQFGLGEPVPLGQARPGDFLQYWRRLPPERPSGHSVVFLGWTPEGGIRYWSSQPSTDGVGERVEHPERGWRLAMARAWA